MNDVSTMIIKKVSSLVIQTVNCLRKVETRGLASDYSSSNNLMVAWTRAAAAQNLTGIGTTWSAEAAIDV